MISSGSLSKAEGTFAFPIAFVVGLSSSASTGTIGAFSSGPDANCGDRGGGGDRDEAILGDGCLSDVNLGS